jgi:uncharacterized membrane protein
MRLAVFATLCLLAACKPGGGADVPGDSSETQPYSGIGPGEILHFAGTEPFWGGQVSGGTLTWTTPERPNGTAIAVERFGGRGGLSFSGTLDGAALDLMVTPGECSDGMSDRTYPFTVTVKLAQETLKGCGWSDVHPFTGPKAP